MATAKVRQKFRAAISALALLIRPAASTPDLTSFSVISGAGAPVNATTTIPSTRGFYLRTDGTTLDLVLYVTVNGGTTWTAAVLAS